MIIPCWQIGLIQGHNYSHSRPSGPRGAQQSSCSDKRAKGSIGQGLYIETCTFEV